MLQWLNTFRGKDAKDRNREADRRIYYFESERPGLGHRPRTAYLSIHEYRSGDDWRDQRDRLKRVVERELLCHASIVAVGQISYWRVWASIIPSVVPSHWITAGYRSTENRWDKVPIIQFPASLGDSEGVVRDIAEPISWAIDALPLPPSLQLEGSKKRVFSLTLLSALSIAVRARMGRS